MTLEKTWDYKETIYMNLSKESAIARCFQVLSTMKLEMIRFHPASDVIGLLRLIR